MPQITIEVPGKILPNRSMQFATGFLDYWRECVLQAHQSLMRYIVTFSTFSPAILLLKQS
jgi:hypothetical protein